MSQMAEPFIIRRKLRVPLLPPGHLRRERLLEALKAGVPPEKRLTLVHGSPGFGKSTLVADYAGWAGLPVVWYNLADSDGDVLVFVEHLIAGLQTRFPDLGGEPLALVRAAQNPAGAVGAAIGLLCDELAARGQGHFLLVLDDFHCVEAAPGIREAGEALVEYFMHDAQLVIISRTQPALNLPRLRVRQQLVELGPGQLKFEKAEIARLFRDQAGLELGEAELDAVARQTEGWIASVLLAIRAGLPLRPGELTEQLEDYLLQEVYDRQEPELRRALLGAGLLPRIEAGWCADILGFEDPRRFMATVWERNLFVSLSGTADGSAAYQFHPIFRTFLQERAKADLPQAELRAIHRKIGERLLEEAPAEAVIHFLAGGEPAQAVAKAARLGWKLLRGQKVESLAQMLAKLPAELSRESAEVQVLGGEVCRARGDFDGALERFALARSLAETAGDAANHGLALALSAAVLGARGDPRLEETAERALAVLPAGESFGRAMAHNALGVRYLFGDRTQEALREFGRAQDQYREAGDSSGEARVLHNKGLAQVRLGRFTQAVADYRDSIRLSEREGRWALPMTYNNLALVWGYLGQYDQALADASRALELARQLQSRRDEAFVLWTLGEVHLKRGHRREAQDYFAQSRETAIGLGDRPSEAMALAGTASVELEEGRADRALALLRQALELRGHRDGDPTLGDLVYPVAKAHLAAGNREEALRILEPARAYLEEKGYLFRLVQVLLDLAKAHGLDDAAGAAGQERLALAREIGLAQGYEHLLERETGGPAVAVTVAEPAAPAIAIWSFGQFRVEIDEREIGTKEWRGFKTKLILAYLLGNRRGATKEELAELFYSDQDTTRSAIHVLISRLRQALEPGLDKTQTSRFVRFVAGRYVFNFDIAHWWDARELEYHLGRGRDAGLPQEERMAAMRRAVDLYHGAYLAEFQAESWCQVESEHYRRKVEAAFETLIADAQERGAFDEVVDLADRNLAVDATCERAHQAKMTALARVGRRDAALRHFQTMEQILQRELGLKPSDDLLALHKRILAGQA